MTNIETLNEQTLESSTVLDQIEVAMSKSYTMGALKNENQLNEPSNSPSFTRITREGKMGKRRLEDRGYSSDSDVKTLKTSSTQSIGIKRNPPHNVAQEALAYVKQLDQQYIQSGGRGRGGPIIGPYRYNYYGRYQGNNPLPGTTFRGGRGSRGGQGGRGGRGGNSNLKSILDSTIDTTMNPETASTVKSMIDSTIDRMNRQGRGRGRGFNNNNSSRNNSSFYGSSLRRNQGMQNSSWRNNSPLNTIAYQMDDNDLIDDNVEQLVDRLNNLSIESNTSIIPQDVTKLRQFLTANQQRQKDLAAHILTVESNIKREEVKTRRRNMRRNVKRTMRRIDNLAIRNNKLKRAIQNAQAL